ncbi:MAG TPA: hypothetical protein EYQ50_01905 [Verrucomicrobiales bacterium]|nr:hypothetical protein [Verrucomicrobiales bacterium]HIL70359.1 hypothetical protein [Verrucomicrobiota bacterium]
MTDYARMTKAELIELLEVFEVKSRRPSRQKADDALSSKRAVSKVDLQENAERLRAILETLGCSPQQVTLLNLSDIVHPDSPPHCRGQ